MDAYDEYAPPENLPAPIPAATLVVFRRNPGGGPAQLLMVERAATLAFAGGAAVFPGGRIDESDREIAAALGTGDRDELAARETLEETGLVVGVTGHVSEEQAQEARAMLLNEGALAPVLTRFGWTVAPERLVPF